MKINLNGTFIDRDEARIDPLDRGFLLADGLFETIRVEDGNSTRTDRHLHRLSHGCDVLGMSFPKALKSAIAETISANKVSNGVLRLTITRGPGPRGVLPPKEPDQTVMISVTPSDTRPPNPMKAIIAETTRRNEFSPLSRCKSLNYLDNIIARQEANDRGADEALLLNTAGNLAEATAANLFLVIDGMLLTPPVSDGALPGVMREEVLPDAEERTLEPGDFARASEAFLTNSLGVRPLVTVDGVPSGAGVPGSMTKKYLDK
jgi:branched-chain amino acid aminotransferase